MISNKEAWLIILGFLKGQDRAETIRDCVRLINEHFKLEDE